MPPNPVTSPAQHREGSLQGWKSLLRNPCSSPPAPPPSAVRGASLPALHAMNHLHHQRLPCLLPELPCSFHSDATLLPSVSPPRLLCCCYCSAVVTELPQKYSTPSSPSGEAAQTFPRAWQQFLHLGGGSSFPKHLPAASLGSSSYKQSHPPTHLSLASPRGTCTGAGILSRNKGKAREHYRD